MEIREAQQENHHYLQNRVHDLTEEARINIYKTIDALFDEFPKRDFLVDIHTPNEKIIQHPGILIKPDNIFLSLTLILHPEGLSYLCD